MAPIIEAGENDVLIVRKLEANKNAFGIFGYSFLEQNADKIQGSLINGVADDYDNISSGKYPISRSLFFYVKKAHVGVIPGIKEFIAEFTSDKAWGPDGYLADKGLIALPDAEREKWRETGARTRQQRRHVDVAPSPTVGERSCVLRPVAPRIAPAAGPMAQDDTESDAANGTAMQLLILTATLLVLTVIGFYLGRSRAVGCRRRPVACGCIRCRATTATMSPSGARCRPADLARLAGRASRQILRRIAVASLPREARALPPERLGLLLNDIRNLAQPAMSSARAADPALQAGRRSLQAECCSISRLAMFGLSSSALAIAGLVLCTPARSRRSCAPATGVEQVITSPSDRLLDRRHPHHRSASSCR